MENRNPFIRPSLTDLYEVTMAYAYFTGNRHNDHSVFDLFFRKNPFGGEYAVCAGISEAIAFLENYRWSPEDIAWVAERMPRCSEPFRRWLAGLNCADVTIHAIREGDLMFPRVPILRVEGPLGICQLLESTLLNIVGYASLVATNGARLKYAAGPGRKVVEFGLRRAQGPDGAISAARYSYLGGVDGTSNVLAGKLFDIPISGTQAHAYISSFTDLDQLATRTLPDPTDTDRDFVPLVLDLRRRLGYNSTHVGELAAFIAYAQAFPNGFLALVDTYDTLHSGIPNAICVALALTQLGYTPIGIRLDSGDLSHLSLAARRLFAEAAARTGIHLPPQTIVASNELDERTLHSLNLQGHDVDLFGIGTRLVTCEGNPSLGTVYKLVEINGRPRIKLSEESTKVTIPGQKVAFRLFGSEGHPLVDLMIGDGESPPQPGQRVLCCHPYERKRRTFVTPATVEPVNHLVWNGAPTGPILSLKESRELCRTQIARLREDHLRELNPTPYKVSLSAPLFDFMHALWEKEAAIGELF